MAIVKKRLDTRDYNLCNTDVYLEYDDELYNITLLDDHNIVVTNKETGNALAVFDARVTGFIVHKVFNNELKFFVSYFDKEKKKYYLQEYNSSRLTTGVLSPLIVPSISYEDIYLGYGSFIINDVDMWGINKRPGNRIFNPFNSSNRITRKVKKIYKSGNHPKYVHITEVLVFDIDEFGMTRDYDEITYGIDLKSLDICTSIYSQRMNKYFEVYEDKADENTLVNLTYQHDKTGYYDITKPGDVTIINNIIKPLMAAEPEKHAPDFKRLVRTIKRT